jgi:hypothetical protein
MINVFIIQMDYSQIGSSQMDLLPPVLDLLCGSLEMLPCDLRLEHWSSLEMLVVPRAARFSHLNVEPRPPPQANPGGNLQLAHELAAHHGRRHTHGCLATPGQSRQAAVRGHD